MSEQVIKLKINTPVIVTRPFTSLRKGGDKLLQNHVAKPALYVFKSAATSLDSVMLQQIGTGKEFFCPVEDLRWFDNYGAIVVEVTTDLISKPDTLTKKDKLRIIVSKFDANFKGSFSGLNKQGKMSMRNVIAKKYINSKELVCVRSPVTNLPVYYDGKSYKTWNSWGKLTYGLQTAKIIPTNELENHQVPLELLKIEYFSKYGDYTATSHTMTLKLIKMLSQWHIDNAVSSCHLNINVTEARLKNYYRYFRRNGYKMIVVRNNNGDIMARTIVDGEGNYTRIYATPSSVDSKIIIALENIGVKKSDYAGTFIACINKDDTLSIPYIDGSDRFNLIDGSHVTTKKGKRFALCEWNNHGAFKAEKQTFNVALNQGIRCDCCGERYDNEREGTYTADGQSICDSCYQDDYFCCQECDETYHNDNQTRFIYENRNGNLEDGYCCENCADSMDSMPFRRG
jgi:hypothetical protein